LKFGVYVKNVDDYYYLGDIREFTTSGGGSPYLSYLNIDRVTKKTPTQELVLPNQEIMDIIEKELDKPYLSRNLMDETITKREYIKDVIS